MQTWKILEIHDRHYVLRWLRDEYPREFWFIANEQREQELMRSNQSPEETALGQMKVRQ